MWNVIVRRQGHPDEVYSFQNEASAKKKYREVQKKWRGTMTTYRLISPDTESKKD